jgi:hypothetical protein
MDDVEQQVHLVEKNEYDDRYKGIVYDPELSAHDYWLVWD